MAVAVAKKKSKAKPIKRISENKMRELAEKSLTEFGEASEERYKRARAIYEAQDDETQDALDRMIALLCEIARTKMWVRSSRDPQSVAVMVIPDQVVKQNMTYMAVEILKDLAEFDVRVANFKMPSNLCGVCSKPIKKSKKVKKRG